MSLETAQYIHQLNPSFPSGADRVKDGDDHLRLIKTVLQATFPGIQGPLSSSVTHTFLNGVAGLLIPDGAIVLWSGASANVPAGWAICDGRTVTKSDGVTSFTTPDLRDRVPAGASTAHAVGTTYGQTSKDLTTNTAGDHTHTASTGSAGSHSHGGVTGGHTLTEAEIPSHKHYTVASGNGGDTTVTSATAMGSEKTSGGDSNYRLVGTGGAPSLSPTSSTGGGAEHTHPINQDGSHSHVVSVNGVAAHSHTLSVDVTQPSIALYFIIKV